MKSKFFQEQETRGLLINSGRKTCLSQITIFSHISFWRYEINKLINKFLLSGDKFKTEMHLSQPSFSNSACGPFTKKN